VLSWASDGTGAAFAAPVSCTRSPRAGAVVPAVSLAGRLPTGGDAWLLVTRCEVPDGEFLVQLLCRPLPYAHGGDVLIRLRAGAFVSGPELARVEVVAVAGGTLVLAGCWESAEWYSWPERVRPAVAFAVTALDWLYARGADTGIDAAVSLDDGDDVLRCGLVVPQGYQIPDRRW
jgi:hypothetical protein